MALNKTKRDSLKLQQDLMGAVYFFHNATSPTLKFEHCLGVKKYRKFSTYSVGVFWSDLEHNLSDIMGRKFPTYFVGVFWSKSDIF